MVASLTMRSWNQLLDWLKRVETLRNTFGDLAVDSVRPNATRELTVTELQ